MFTTRPCAGADVLVRVVSTVRALDEIPGGSEERSANGSVRESMISIHTGYYQFQMCYGKFIEAVRTKRASDPEDAIDAAVVLAAVVTKLAGELRAVVDAERSTSPAALMADGDEDE